MRPILADSDIGQVVVFLVVALIAFVQWLIKMLKEKMGESRRTPHIATDEEEEARRRAWREQTRPAPPVASPTPAGGMLDDLIGELQKALEPTREPRTPPRPPRLPGPAQSGPARPLAPSLPVAVVESLPQNVPVLQTLRPDLEPHPLTALLRTAGGYRQAFVLREVLGPPRALQEYAGPD
jgi:hypothetical protein